MPKNLAGWIFGLILILATVSTLQQNPGAFQALLDGIVTTVLREVVRPLTPFVIGAVLLYGAYRYWRSRQ